MNRSQSEFFIEENDLSGNPAILFDVLHKLGGHRTLAVFKSSLPNAANSSSLQTMSEVANLTGATAEASTSIPAVWQIGLDGALIGMVSGRLVAVVRQLGEMYVFPDASMAPTAALRQIEQCREVLHVRVVPEADAGRLRYWTLRNRAKRVARHVFFQSLLINLLALLVPFFSMAVYNRVLGGGAVSSLWPLLTGAIVVLTIMVALRLLRSRLIAVEYSRLKATMELLVQDRLSRQAVGSRLKMSSERQANLVRQASGAADVFSSANLMAIYDSPFLVLSLLAILFVGGKLALIPLISLLVFFGLAYLLDGGRSSSDPEVAHLASERQIRISELHRHAPEIRRSGLSAAWLKRFDQTVRAAARDGMRAQQWSGALQSIGFFMGTGTALATLIVGLDLALQDRLSPGVLIGTMLLTWRITGPAQALFLGLPRLRKIKLAWSRLEGLLVQPSVSAAAHAQEPFPMGALEIEGRGLFYRFDAAGSPAVSGISFKVEPGQIVAVIGPNGSGKSCLMQMLAGQLPPQSGSLLINGRSISQFDPDDISVSIAHLSTQSAQDSADDNGTFEGEVQKDLRLWSQVTAKEAGLYLLDDPMPIGGPSSQKMISTFLGQKRGNATVFFASHDTTLVEQADLALVLDHGSPVYFGPVKTSEDPNKPKPHEEAH